MFSVLLSVLILSFLVLIHELGHFLVAKKSGVLVEEFGIGLPPRLWGKKIGETVYSINALPLGGFVRLHGENPSAGSGQVPSAGSGQVPSAGSPRLRSGQASRLSSGQAPERGLYAQKPLRRTLILFAGILLNFLLGFLIIWGLFMVGHDIALNGADIAVTNRRVIITSIAKQSPAEASGFQLNDIVKTTDNNGEVMNIQDSNQFTELMKLWAGTELKIGVIRQNKPITLIVVPRPNPPSGQGPLGVGLMEIGRVQYGFFKAGWEALKASGRTSIYMFQAIGSLFGQLFTSGDLTGFSGPVGIIKYTSSAVAASLAATLNLMAMISLNLAVFNLFPLPALDGGRIAFALWEAISKKPVSQKIESMIHTIGFGLLLALLIVVTIVDIRKII